MCWARRSQGSSGLDRRIYQARTANLFHEAYVHNKALLDFGKVVGQFAKSLVFASSRALLVIEVEKGQRVCGQQWRP